MCRKGMTKTAEPSPAVGRALILFTRVPEAGRTKTRLSPELSAEQCAGAQSAFLSDIFGACLAPGEWDTLVFYGGEGPIEDLHRLLPGQLAFFPQSGDGLGERMDAAIRRTLGMGYTECVLTGTDVPELHRGIIAGAFALLDGHDLVLGPTLDGGYYLIGCRRPCTAVFAGQTYGGGSVLANTLEAARRAGLSCAQTRLLRDVDEPEDLRALAARLAQSGDVCPNTRAFLRELGWITDTKQSG